MTSAGANQVLPADAARHDPIRRRRILLLSPAFPPSTGGIERTAAELAGGLDDFSIEVVAGCPVSSVGMRPPAGIKVHWAANDPPYGRRATVALNRLALKVGVRFKPDLVLALHTRTMPAARALSRMHRVPVVLVLHAKEMPEQPALARASVRWADAIVTVSDYSRELALQTGADESRTVIIHPGVTSAPTAPLPLASRPGPPTIITVARMGDSHKGHDVAIAAMERLHARVPTARWIMIGDGSLRDRYRMDASQRGLEHCISFPGAVDDDDLHRRLAAAHAFCLLSRQPPAGAAGEGFGIAFVEAGAHGLPVVAGRVPGVVDAVHDGVTGILVEPTDPDAVADALERVLLDADLGQRLADAGRRWAQELAWPLVVSRYRTLIEGVLSAPPRRGATRDLRWMLDLAGGPGP